MCASTSGSKMAPECPCALHGAIRRARSWAASLIFVAVVFGPLIALLAQTGASARAGDLGDASSLLLADRQAVLLGRSMGLAAGTALAALLVGLAVATVLWGWRRAPWSHLRWLAVVLAPVPPYIHGMAWMHASAVLSRLLAARGLAPLPFRGWGAAWFVGTMAQLPLAVGLALIGLEMVDPAQFEAARLLAPDVQALSDIALPLSAPFLAAGGALLFILGLTDYGLPSLFAVNTYAMEPFAEYSATSEPARAFVLSFPLLVLACVAVFYLQRALRDAASTRARGQRSAGVALSWPAGLRAIHLGALLTLAVHIAVPAVALATVIASPSGWLETLRLARGEIGLTTRICLITSVLSLPLALIAAERMRATGSAGRIWRVMVGLPLAVPASLVGVGLISLRQHVLPPALTDGSSLLVLAALARFAPYAALVLLAQMRRQDPLLSDAARVMQTSPWQGWWRVRLPLLAPGLLAAGCIVFALTAGELGATLALAPPGHATITMRIYTYLHYGATDEVAGLCLAMVLLAAVAGGAAAWALARGPRRAGVGGGRSDD
ncbi:MAG TPA: iron ABC transporter permease [Armatimonadetes bacterium]|nr:iron ABC transporter permease [Armatimonadota bacterium]